MTSVRPWARHSLGSRSPYARTLRSRRRQRQRPARAPAFTKLHLRRPRSSDQLRRLPSLRPLQHLQRSQPLQRLQRSQPLQTDRELRRRLRLLSSSAASQRPRRKWQRHRAYRRQFRQPRQ